MVKYLYFVLRFIGIDPLTFYRHITGLPHYYRALKQIKKQQGSDTSFFFGKKYPYLRDRFSQAGNMSSQYFTQDLFVARKIFKNNPVKHVDIGSRIDGFVAHVAVFREIEIVDIREQKSTERNIKFRQADLMVLPQDMQNYSDSISSLHAIEHFGLGRYGDPINYFGHIEALKNIGKILKPGGKFYFASPIGIQRIEFNAHRVFSVKYLWDIFKENYDLDGFSFMDDQGNFIEDTLISDAVIAKCASFSFGLGIFELTKRKD